MTKIAPIPDFTHWLGIRLTGPMVLRLERFKKTEAKLAYQAWCSRYPAFQNIPPIYWQRGKWIWTEIKPEHIVEYVTLCDALVNARLNTSKKPIRPS
jgi:hypothetical protein